MRGRKNRTLSLLLTLLILQTGISGAASPTKAQLEQQQVQQAVKDIRAEQDFENRYFCAAHDKVEAMCVNAFNSCLLKDKYALDFTSCTEKYKRECADYRAKYKADCNQSLPE